MNEDCTKCTANCRYCNKPFVERKSREADNIAKEYIKISEKYLIVSLLIWIVAGIVGIYLFSKFM